MSKRTNTHCARCGAPFGIASDQCAAQPSFNPTPLDVLRCRDRELSALLREKAAWEALWERAARSDGNGPRLILFHEGADFENPASVYFEHAHDDECGEGVSWGAAAIDLARRLKLIPKEASSG